MSLCTEVGHWITENIVEPVERFFEEAHEQCREARRWVEREIRRPIESWREEQERRCKEQECNWFCLCCNKWFCWIVTVLVRVIEWVIEVVGEWLVEIICNIVVEIVRFIVMTVIQVTRWIVEFVVCIVEKFCEYLYFLIGLALIALLIGLVVTVGALLLPLTIPALIAGAAVAGAALLLALVVCDSNTCRLLGVLVWALKWAIVIGALVAIFTLSIASAFIVVLYGGVIAALIWALISRGCRIPDLFGKP